MKVPHLQGMSKKVQRGLSRLDLTTGISFSVLSFGWVLNQNPMPKFAHTLRLHRCLSLMSIFQSLYKVSWLTFLLRYSRFYCYYHWLGAPIFCRSLLKLVCTLLVFLRLDPRKMLTIPRQMWANVKGCIFWSETVRFLLD